jgi:ABC-type transport system involved in cytochrome c biogenesis permease subunit
MLVRPTIFVVVLFATYCFQSHLFLGKRVLVLCCFISIQHLKGLRMLCSRHGPTDWNLGATLMVLLWHIACAIKLSQERNHVEI